jgi:hypothetical protein
MRYKRSQLRLIEEVNNQNNKINERQGCANERGPTAAAVVHLPLVADRLA